MELNPFQNSLSREAAASEVFCQLCAFWQPTERYKKHLPSPLSSTSIFLWGWILMCLFAGAAELGATTEELLGPVTGELVILYFKATHCYKEK